MPKQPASSRRNYDIVVRSFLVYLGTKHPKLARLEQLRRDPHILGRMAHQRVQNPPLAASTCIGRLFALRTIFHELARTNHLAELAHLLLREDIPRSLHSATTAHPRTGSTPAAGVHAKT